jgi:hypothetical protein
MLECKFAGQWFAEGARAVGKIPKNLAFQGIIRLIACLCFVGDMRVAAGR